MRKEINMTEGPVTIPMIRYAIPIILSGLLQTLYNAADTFIVGRSGVENAIGAVGSAGPAVNMILNLILGLSAGAGIVVARYCGAKEEGLIKKTINTSMFIAIIGGILSGVLGIILSASMAEIMKIDPDIRDMSVLYMRIVFLGTPCVSIYNFCAALMNGMGKTKEPMMCLMISGLVNVILNIIFVMGLGMDVDGVALATIISQLVSAMLIMVFFKRNYSDFSLKNVKADKKIAVTTIKIGIPGGLQGMMFSFGNAAIMSAINSFGAVAATAGSISGQVEAIIYYVVVAFEQTVVTFTSQNIGSKKPERINIIIKNGLIISVSVCLLLGVIGYLNMDNVSELFAPGNDSVKEFVRIQLKCMVMFYSFMAFMNVFAGALKGMNKTFTIMVINIFCILVFRLIWIFILLPNFRSIGFLYISYPLSWLLTACVNVTEYVILKKKLNIAIKEGRNTF